MTGPMHRHFHDALAALKTRLLQMSGDVQGALGLALEALEERNATKAEAVIAGDRHVDHREMEIEEAVIALLATQQPMAGDLRLLMAAMKISNDLERVGDHAVNIAQSVQRLLAVPQVPIVPDLWEIARHARRMLADALEAFIKRDGAAARAVCRRDDTVDALHRAVFRIAITHMMEDPRTITAGMELVLVSRNLERVADLATNIAEDVVFMAEGRSIKHGAEAGSPGGRP